MHSPALFPSCSTELLQSSLRATQAFWMEPQVRTIEKTSVCNSWLRAGWELLHPQLFAGVPKAALTLFPAGHGPKQQTKRLEPILSSTFPSPLNRAPLLKYFRKELFEETAVQTQHCLLQHTTFLVARGGKLSPCTSRGDLRAIHTHTQDYQPPSSPLYQTVQHLGWPSCRGQSGDCLPSRRPLPAVNRQQCLCSSAKGLCALGGNFAKWTKEAQPFQLSFPASFCLSQFNISFCV